MDDRTSDADITDSRASFRDRLKDRDGTCIITDAPPLLCEGSHYYPHSKGSEYLTRLVANQGGGHDIVDIDDIRNGLLLSRAIHKVFGLGHVAFLMTPNFALVEHDVPPSPGPILGPQSASPGRFTLHHFRQLDQYTTFNSPHNQDARLPADINQFPPPIIVDMSYGCAAMLQWGISQSSAAIWSSVESLYYDNTGSGRAGSSERDDPKALRNLRAKQWANRHRAQSGSHLNTIDEAMDLVMLLWSQQGPGDREEPTSTQEEDFRRERVNLQAQ